MGDYKRIEHIATIVAGCAAEWDYYHMQIEATVVPYHTRGTYAVTVSAPHGARRRRLTSVVCASYSDADIARIVAADALTLYYRREDADRLDMSDDEPGDVATSALDDIRLGEEIRALVGLPSAM